MKRKLALIGSGTLASIIAGACSDGLMPRYELVCIMGLDSDSLGALADKAGCEAVDNINDLVSHDPDFVVEAASVDAVKACLPEVLKAGISFVPLSIGAFADKKYHEKVIDLAEESHAKVYLPSGAIGGYDVLRTISMMEGAKMEFSMNKSRVNMKGTALYDKCPESGDPVTIFEGSAEEAIELLPGHVNVAVAASLATVGPDRMGVVILSDPNDYQDEMVSSITADRASAYLKIRSTPPDVAGWSVVALLNNLASPIQFA